MNKELVTCGQVTSVIEHLDPVYSHLQDQVYADSVSLDLFSVAYIYIGSLDRSEQGAFSSKYLDEYFDEN